MKIRSKKNNILFLIAIMLSILFHTFFVFSKHNETIQNVGLNSNTGTDQNSGIMENDINKQKSKEYEISNLQGTQKENNQEKTDNETSEKHVNKRSQNISYCIIKDNVIKISKIKNIDNITILYIKKNNGKNKYFVKKTNEELKEVSRDFIQKEYSENIIRISNNEEIEMVKNEGLDPNLTIAALILTNQIIKKIKDVFDANGIDIERMKGMEIRLTAIQDGFKLGGITKLVTE
jgi:hypothetical protein